MKQIRKPMISLALLVSFALSGCTMKLSGGNIALEVRPSGESEAQITETASSVQLGTVVSQGSCGEQLTWQLDENGLLLVSGKGAMCDTPKEAPDGWGEQLENIRTVCVQEGVTSIAEYAFWGCSSLTSVTIPASVKWIGTNAFPRRAPLTGFSVADGNPQYTAPDGVLIDKARKTLIHYPIGKQDESYTIPDWVTAIGENAFGDCAALTNVTIPEGVVSIGSSAFSRCTALKSIVIPNGVTDITVGVFAGCKALTDVTIPDSVTSVMGFAFLECSALTEVEIPVGVTRFDVGAFKRCSALTAIHVAPDNPVFTDLDGVIFDKSLTTLIEYPGGKTDSSYSIPESVTCVDYDAFAGNSFLTSVTIPDGVIRIHDEAFDGCASLVSADIPEGVEEIENDLFSGCTCLTSVTIPDSAKYIAIEAFKDCVSLANVEIPEGVESIGPFAFQGCTSLTSATIPDSVIGISETAFLDCESLVIRGHTGSKAEAYAKENNIPFEQQ